MTTSKCRTCLNPNTKVLSLDSKPKMLNVSKTYMDMLKYIASIESNNVNETKLPQGICSACTKKLRDSYNFIEQVQRCNQYFVNEINSTSTKYDEDDISPEDAVAALSETPCIKQECTMMLEEDAVTQPQLKVTSRSSNKNEEVLPKSIHNMRLNQAAEEFKIAAKTESATKNEPREQLYPECVINEVELAERDASSDSESSDSEWSHADPLDNDTDEDTKPTSMVDEMLPVRCDECERVFANSILLSRHKKDTHLPDELKIQCPSCPVKFSRRYNMYAHMRTFHKSETVREHQIQPRKLTKTDICGQCHRSYSDKYKLMAHIKSKHGPASVPKKPKQPPKQYLCTLCGLTCTNKSNLEIHYRRRHTGEKPFKCDLCDRAFTRSYEVKVHRRTHTGEAPYKCAVCEKAFKRSNKLKIHMRIHTNERPYKCTECEKAFRESKDLNIHRRTHTGERPYRCSVCNSTFTQSNSLKLHQKKKKHFQETSGTSSSSSTLVALNKHSINTLI